MLHIKFRLALGGALVALVMLVPTVFAADSGWQTTYVDGTQCVKEDVQTNPLGTSGEINYGVLVRNETQSLGNFNSFGVFLYCAAQFSRPAYYMADNIELYGYSFLYNQWFLMVYTDWTYNPYATWDWTIQWTSGGAPGGPCSQTQICYYGTWGGGYQWNGQWYGSWIWSNDQWLDF